MTTAAREPELVEQEVTPQLPMIGGAMVDIQVATARRFPRSITRFMQHAQEMATLTPDIAKSCIYAIPRGGKMIEGPSARLAEIVAHAWGNLRIQAGASEADDRFIVGRGESWDVETNVAIAFEVRRRITDSRGDTYNDDMITVTGNAAASIALRNSVFKTVPSSFWRPIYLKCREVIAGDAKTFHSRRDDLMKAFGVMGVTPDQIFQLMKVKGVLDITLEHMVTLTGIFNSLKDGEATIEDVFPAALQPIKPAERKSEQQQTAPAQESSQASAPSTTEPGTGNREPGPAKADEQVQPAKDAPKNIGVITKVEHVSGGAFIHLDTGFACSTRKPDFIKAAENHRDKQTRVELMTTVKDPKYAPVLDTIEKVTD